MSQSELENAVLAHIHAHHFTNAPSSTKGLVSRDDVDEMVVAALWAVPDSVIAGFRRPTADVADPLRAAARALVDIYDAAAPDWWPPEIEELRAALDPPEEMGRP